MISWRGAKTSTSGQCFVMGMLFYFEHLTNTSRVHNAKSIGSILLNCDPIFMRRVHWSHTFGLQKMGL